MQVVLEILADYPVARAGQDIEDHILIIQSSLVDDGYTVLWEPTDEVMKETVTGAGKVGIDCFWLHRETNHVEPLWLIVEVMKFWWKPG
jgi:hypothetical protein